MSIEDLKPKIRDLYLPWQRCFDAIVGESDLGPIKTWLGLIFLIILEIFFSLRLTFNLASNIRQLSTEAQAVASLQNKIKNIQSGYEIIQAKSKATEELLGRLTGSKLNSEFLEKITLWAGLNQITLEGINFLPPEAPSQPGLLKRQVDLVVWGEYGHLLAFVETINHQEPSTVIAGLRLSLNAKKNSPNRIESKISLLRYYTNED